MRRRTVPAVLPALVAGGALAQHAAKVYSIGVEPFSAALRERGWVVGRDARLELRLSGPSATDINALARELVAARVDVIVVVGTHMAPAAAGGSRAAWSRAMPGPAATSPGFPLTAAAKSCSPRS